MAGRPTKYTKKIADAICERLATGESLRSVCGDEKMPNESTVRKWAAEDREGFYTQYARSRDVGLDAMAEEVLAISDDARNDWMERNGNDSEGWQLNGENVQRSRLRVDARKWYLSKIAPKRYGDRQTLEHSGPGGGAINVRDVESLSDEELMRIAAGKK